MNIISQHLTVRSARPESVRVLLQEALKHSLNSAFGDDLILLKRRESICP